MRMKAHMTSHVDEHRKTMFHESTEEVKKHLKQMCGLVEEQMMNKADEVFVLMRRDYMTVVTGAHIPQGEVMPKWERTMKAEIAKVIQEKEDAAEKEENPEMSNSQMDMDQTADQESSSTPIKADPNSENDHYESDVDLPARDIADSIQDALNQEIEEEFGEPKEEEH
jgi:hypothetical protein